MCQTKILLFNYRFRKYLGLNFLLSYTVINLMELLKIYGSITEGGIESLMFKT